MVLPPPPPLPELVQGHQGLKAPAPPYLSWCRVIGASKLSGFSAAFGLMHRTKCSPVASSSAISSRS